MVGRVRREYNMNMGLVRVRAERDEAWSLELKAVCT